LSPAKADDPERMLLLFALGGRRFVASADHVRRVARCGTAGVRFWNDTHLGNAGAAVRGLVSTLNGSDEALVVDEVHGMVAGVNVHALPALVAACLPGSAIAGLIEFENELLPLVDLPALLQKRVDREERDGAERGEGERRGQTPGAEGHDD
jgi:hypothetical protein